MLAVDDVEKTSKGSATSCWRGGHGVNCQKQIWQYAPVKSKHLGTEYSVIHTLVAIYVGADIVGAIAM